MSRLLDQDYYHPDEVGIKLTYNYRKCIMKKINIGNLDVSGRQMMENYMKMNKRGA